MNVEIELKLRVPPSSMAKLNRHILLKSPKNPLNLVSRYFDTPSLDLKSKGIALRLRKVGRRWIQTVKGGGNMLAGVHTRNEWEIPLHRDALDFTRFDDPLLVEIFGNAALRRDLEEVFHTEFTRKTVPVEFGGSLIEYCLDRGKIVSGEKEEAISEIELELKSGDPSSLFEFALELQKTVPLFIEGRSKAERGYVLYVGGMINRVRKVQAADLEGRMDVEAAFREILKACLEQIQSNLQGFLDREEDYEYLHQIRVGLRRMRSAFSLFSRHFGTEAFSEIVFELRWLGRELGPARNWDVFLFETLAPIREAFPVELDGLHEEAENKRRKYNECAIEAVSSQRFQILMLNLGALMTRKLGGEPLTIAHFARDRLEKLYRSFRKRGGNIERLSLAELHALRITGKKLRYAAEFFSCLYPAPASRDFLKAMAGIQDILGSINDAETTNHLLEELSDTDRGLVRGWVGCKTANSLSHAGLQWKAFERIMPFWK